MSPEGATARDAIFAAAEAEDDDAFMTAWAAVLDLPDKVESDDIRSEFQDAYGE